MDSRKHNHYILTSWEKVANERDSKVLMVITAKADGSGEDLDLLTMLTDNDQIASRLEALAKAIRKGLMPKMEGYTEIPNHK